MPLCACLPIVVTIPVVGGMRNLTVHIYLLIVLSQKLARNTLVTLYVCVCKQCQFCKQQCKQHTVLGLVWFGSVWFGLMMLGAAWCGLVRLGAAWCGLRLVRLGAAWYSQKH